MKKLLALILVLALLLPAAALAAESDVIGCWAHYSPLSDGAPFVEVIVLAEDHTCYYLSQMYSTDEAGLGRTFVGTWEMNADGTVTAKIGNNTSATLRFSGTYVGAMDTKTGALFVHLDLFY